MSDLHSGENCRFTEMNTNELERLLREDALGQETDPEDVEMLFEAMQELASRQEEAIDTEKAYASFKTHYAPRRNSEESMYAQTDGGSRGLRKILWPAAAAAVIAVGILIPGLLRWKPWSPQPEQPQENLPGSVVSVAIPDGEGREVAVGTVSVDRYSVSATIEGKDSQEHFYEVSVSYSFYTDNTAMLNQYWTVLGDPVTTSGEQVILQEFGGSGYENLHSAEVTFREFSSGESVTQSILCIGTIFE